MKEWRKEEGKGRWEGDRGEGRNGGKGKALCVGGRDGWVEEGMDGWTESREDGARE